MTILGLHFGHDASMALVKDGRLLACYEIERIRKTKHAIGIKAEEVRNFLVDLNVSPKDITGIAVTTSQGIEFLFDRPEQFTFEYIKDYKDSRHKASWSRERAKLLKENNAILETSVVDLLGRESPEGHPFYKYLKGGFEKPENGSWLGTFENYIEPSNSDKSKYSGLKEGFARLNTDGLENGFQYPIKVNLLGEEKNGYVYSHHYAHACYAHFELSGKNKLIFSHDGSLPSSAYRSGALYYAEGKNIKLVGLHHLAIGKMYEISSGLLGFSEDSGPGKMMGLAPYGESCIEDNQYMGNYYDLIGKKTVNSAEYRQWVNELCQQILDVGKARSLVADSDINNMNVNKNPMDPKCLLIASSIQDITERNLSNVCAQAISFARREGYLNGKNDLLALTGGTALNCPANTQIAKKLPDVKIFVPPAIHDGGLSVGAAYHLAFELQANNDYNQWFIESPKSLPESAYLGKDQLNKQNSCLEIERCCDAKSLKVERELTIPKAARMLAEDKIIAVFGSRGEIGPRALGARSILANPNNKHNWKKVNEIKQRELWRPFAPIVLNGHEKEHFEIEENVLSYSYMLFTTAVIKEDIPAVTHIDKSSRVQILKKEDNEIVYELMRRFHSLTNTAVLMNTSFNGPKEPIIDSIMRAIDFMAETDGMDGVLVGKDILILK